MLEMKPTWWVKPTIMNHHVNQPFNFGVENYRECCYPLQKIPNFITFWGQEYLQKTMEGGQNTQTIPPKNVTLNDTVPKKIKLTMFNYHHCFEILRYPNKFYTL